MSLFDRLIAASLPFVPKPLIGVFSRRYIAGEDIADMVRTVRALNGEGAMCTVDVLGEFTTDVKQTEETVAEYERAIAAIVKEKLDCNVSLKLTAFGLLIDDGLCEKNLRRILELARAHGMFVRIDMEDSPVTERTLAMYRRVRADFENVGPVLQAYLRRTLADVRSLLAGPHLNVRLCKGIYNEKPAVAFKERDVVQQSYVTLLEHLLRGGAKVGIATHDPLLIYHGLRLIDELQLDRDRYEFQMLHGVIPEMRRQLLREGHRLRVYVPYGRHWHGYSLRRLKENPKVAGYVFKGIFSRASS